MSIDPSIPEIQNFLNLTLKIQGESEMTMMLHNYRSRQLASTKSGLSAAWYDKFLAMGNPIWGKWANYYDNAQLQV